MDNEEKKEEMKNAEEDNSENATEEKPEPTKLPRVFIVGLGETGREITSRIGKKVKTVGLDINEKKLELTRKRVPDDDVELFQKDDTSRLTWQDLNLEEDDTVVAVTKRDEVNIEVCHVAREHFAVKRLLGLLHSPDKADDYAAVGIETVSRAQVMASFLESRIFRDRRMALNIGLGQGEIMEVPILPGSLAVGRPLRTFRARPWLVGAIYRDDKLIVPHGNTIIREGDRVILIGEPDILSAIADSFKMGMPEFPLQYGVQIGVLARHARDEQYEALVSESHYIAQYSKATSMVLLSVPGHEEPDMEAAETICDGTSLTCTPAYLPEEEHKPWPKHLQAQDFGCMVMVLPKFGILRRVGIRRSLLRRILEEAEFPILISRGSHPYKKILVPVAGNSNPLRVTQLAIDLARLFDTHLDAVTVTEPAFSAGQEAVEEQKQVLDQMVEYSDLFNLKIGIHHREGNPIREIVDLASDYNLIVLGHRQRSNHGILPRLNLALEIMARVSCSVMILPFTEEMP